MNNYTRESEIISHYTENAYDIAVASLSDCDLHVIASDVQNEHKFSVSWSPKGDLLSYTSAGDCFIASVGRDAPQNLTSTAIPGPVY